MEGWEYPWGGEWDPARAIGYWDNRQSTADVGSLPEGASWVGALDMSGNVWEWMADWYAENYYGTLADGAVNPSGPTDGDYRVLRGGSWRNPVTDYFRASYRNRDFPNLRFFNFGFRCARSR